MHRVTAGIGDVVEAVLSAERRWREGSRQRSEAQSAGDAEGETAAAAEMEAAERILGGLESELEGVELPPEAESLRKFRLALTQPTEPEVPAAAVSSGPKIEGGATVQQSTSSSANAVLAFVLGLVLGIVITVLLYRWYLSDKVIIRPGF